MSAIRLAVWQVHLYVNGATQRCTQFVRQRFEHFRVVLTAAQTPPTRHDDLRRRQFRPVQLRQLAAHELGDTRVGRCFDLLYRCAAAFCCDRIETGGTNRDYLDRIARLNRGDGVARVDRTLEGIERCLGRGLSRVRPKGARTVLRGLGAGNRLRLPDIKSGSELTGIARCLYLFPGPIRTEQAQAGAGYFEKCVRRMALRVSGFYAV